METDLVLDMKHISKYFPGVQALDDVNLDLRRNEVLVLVGENGAGKSTLMKILSGALSADSGEIFIDGEKMGYTTPGEAMHSGVRIMYQELNYLEEMSIAENIFLGNWPVSSLLKKVDYKKLKKDCKAILEKVNLHVNPFTLVKQLSVAERQLVEIAKAISDNFKVMVMDEPTASLNEAEIRNLFVIIRELVAQGKSVIYISHRMDEVFEIADRVHVMRDGRSVAVKNIADITREQIVALMVGREIKEMYPKADIEKKDVVFEVEGLTNDFIKDISFNVRGGEIFGLFGLMGSGRTNIVETIYGVRKKTRGTIKINGSTVDIDSPKKAMEMGIAYLPNERKKDGLVLEHTVEENISLSSISKKLGVFKLNLRKESQIADKWIRKLNIKTPGKKVMVQKLSGGNQQKVVLAKALETNPRMLILNEPTRGIDVGAKVEIYKLMEELCAQGMAIIMISSELPEIIGIADRIAVICEGRVKGEIGSDGMNSENLMKFAIGGI